MDRRGLAAHRAEHRVEAAVLLTHAFETLGAQRVAWETDIRNLRSQRAIERLGALREGVLRAHRIRPDGSSRDTVTYSMLAPEWPAAKARLNERLVTGDSPASVKRPGNVGATFYKAD